MEMVLFNKQGSNHLIINIVGGGRGELASCPNVISWDYSYRRSSIVTFSPWRPGGPASPLGPGAPAGPGVPGLPGSPGEPRSP